jgi:crossover junction endodeoxyribonuclease RuvC
MANEPTRILGLDPGLRRTGWGVISVVGSRLSWIAHGVVTPDDKAPFAERLLHLMSAIGDLCAAHGCDEAAIEEVFVNANPASTLKLGQARGAVILGPAGRGLSVAEYAPNLIKKAVVGAGHADKAQVAFMVRRLLPAAGEVSADAADALAVAITHAQLRRMAQVSSPREWGGGPRRGGGGGSGSTEHDSAAPSISPRIRSEPPPHRFATGRRSS